MDIIRREEILDLLDTRCKLNLSLDDLRIILNCFRGIEYQMEIDHEPYLDEHGIALKSRLEKKYRDKLRELGMLSFSNVKAN
jgi:hypothetical protein